ncbi:hypothetical protein LZ31DRAFT_611376 [Colletotrichum somersetense]|nr:hypothetical protein LZ31DRAFT_611376 [Colletotrichum somersetense]
MSLDSWCTSQAKGDFMKDISSTAHLVVAWIQLEEGNVGLLFDYLRGLIHTVRRERNHYLRSQRRKFTFKDAKWFVMGPCWFRVWTRIGVHAGELALGAAQAVRHLLSLCGSRCRRAYVEFSHLSKQENHYGIGKHGESCRKLQKSRRFSRTDPKRLSFTDTLGARLRFTRMPAFSKDFLHRP